MSNTNDPNQEELRREIQSQLDEINDPIRVSKSADAIRKKRREDFLRHGLDNAIKNSGIPVSKAEFEKMIDDLLNQ